MADTDITDRPSPALEAPRPTESETYRPLSLMAIGGFGLGVVFASLVLLGGIASLLGRYPGLMVLIFLAAALTGPVVVLRRNQRDIFEILRLSGIALAAVATIAGLGGLVAFSGSKPWLLPDWMWLVPLAGLLVSWMAISRINDSEDTLGGMTLARWGIYLPLFFGLNYGAFLLSNQFAIRSQATRTSEEFLAHLAKGEVQQAFLLTLPPRSRPTRDIQRSIEVEHNQPSANRPGAYSGFTNAGYVHLLQMAKDEAKWDLITAAAEYEQGSYKLQTTYRITSPLGKVELDIGLNGIEITDPASGVNRRVWQIDLSRTGGPKSQLAPTAEGEMLRTVYGMVATVAQQWGQGYMMAPMTVPHLLSLPTAKRDTQILSEPGVVSVTGVAILGGIGLTTEKMANLAAERKVWEEGKWIDTGDFYGDPKTKEAMARSIRDYLLLRSRVPLNIEVLPSEVPLFEKSEGEVTVRVPVRFISPPVNRSGQPGPLVEGELFVRGPEAKGRVQPAQYRIVKVRLLRGLTPVASGPPGG